MTKFDDIDIFDPKYLYDKPKQRDNEGPSAPRKTAHQHQADTKKMLQFNSKAEMNSYYRSKYREGKEQRKANRINKFNLRKVDPNTPKVKTIWDITQVPLTHEDFLKQSREDYQELIRMKAWLTDNKLDDSYINYKNALVDKAKEEDDKEK